MKKNDLILLISVTLYSLLFYKQAAGINYLIFSIAMIIALVIKDKNVTTNRNWIAAAIGSVLSGATVAYYGTGLTFLANIFSLFILSAFSISKKSSVIFAWFYSFFSMVTSAGFMIVDLIEKKQEKAKTNKESFGIKFLAVIGIIVIIALFFLLYRASNPLFLNFTKNINLNFITIGWIAFTLLGFLLLYGFFYHRNIKEMYEWETQTSDNLIHESIMNKSLTKGMKIENENISGTVLFVLLNILLLIVNILDLNFLWGNGKLPEGMTYSDFVHQGTGTLILSVVIAIAIILFYFRSRLNFYEKNQTIKILACLWIIQNAIMIFSTAFRNGLYINEYSLTYKRIGVYVYLALTMIGLITTFMKILFKKSNWFLFRKNSWAFYSVLIFACFLNWPMIVTNYNISLSKKLDKTYLLELSPCTLPSLINLEQDTNKRNTVINSFPVDDYNEITSSFYLNNPQSFTAQLHQKIYHFLEYREKADWQSWCMNKQNTVDEILQLEEQGKLKIFYLSNSYIETLEPIAKFNHLEELEINNDHITDLAQLKNFPQLHRLDISYNKLNNLNALPELKKLKQLYLRNNQISDFTPLQRAENLEILDVSSNLINDLTKIPVMNKLQTMDISSNTIADYSKLKNYPNLKNLSMTGMVNRRIETLPALPNLVYLNISSNNISSDAKPLFEKIKSYSNLQNMDLSSNAITDLDFLLDKENPVYVNLITLNLSSNKIIDAEKLKYYKNLKELYLTNNQLSNLKGIDELEGLQTLVLSYNQIYDLQTVSKLKNLKVLYLCSNGIKDIRNLKELGKLEFLNLSGNDIQDIKALSQLKNLKTLYLSGNQISDISALSKLNKLELLDLQNNPITDFSMLYQMKSLKELYLPNISKENYQKLFEALPQTNIYTTMENSSSR
jgi:Leucine-rich repeat (LRR) protein